MTKRARVDFNGSRSREKANGGKRSRPRDVPHPPRQPDGRKARNPKRIKGTNGSWPVREVTPRPPAICMLYPDLAEAELPTAVFGQYPSALIPKLLPWLECERHEILHVCSGSLPPGEGIRVDIRPDAKPDILADGRHLPLPDGSQKAVMIDPPYTPQYAKDLYEVEYPLPAHLLAEAARVVRPGGIIAFVHYLVPMPPPNCDFVKSFGLSTGFGFYMRAVTLYRRRQDELPFGVAA